MKKDQVMIREELGIQLIIDLVIFHCKVHSSNNIKRFNSPDYHPLQLNNTIFHIVLSTRTMPREGL